MPDQTIFTIGHSTHDIDIFLDLLHQHNITSLIDVRSAPYSRMAPQFNQDRLKPVLQQHNMLYAHFEQEFGARHTRPSLLDEKGKVDFAKVRETEAFQQGVERLKKGLELGYRLALMCTEANPFDCHRFSLIAYQLVREELSVQHILKDGTLIDNSVLEEQLLEKYQKKLPVSTLFDTVTPEMQLEVAYRLRGQAVAYTALRGNSDET